MQENNMQNNQTLTPEQQQYRSTSALSRKLYDVENNLETLQTQLSQPHNTNTLMSTGFQLNQAINDIRQVANGLYAQKKELETKHPELAAEAKTYGQQMKAEREAKQYNQQNTQSY